MDKGWYRQLRKSVALKPFGTVGTYNTLTLPEQPEAAASVDIAPMGLILGPPPMALSTLEGKMKRIANSAGETPLVGGHDHGAHVLPVVPA